MIAYLVLFLVALIFGQVLGHLNKKLPPVGLEEITYKEFFEKFFKNFKFDFIFTIIYFAAISFIYYSLGITAVSVIYMLLVASLLLVITIDFKYEIIPDELVVYTAILGVIRLCFDFQNWYMYLFGMIVGGVIFYLIGLLGNLLFKKDGMGFGDVKLMAALGLIFGLKEIIVITLLAFLIGAVIGVLILLFKIKKPDEYIPFGPFIVIASYMVMVINSDEIIYFYWNIIGFVSERITDIAYWGYCLFNK